MGVFSSNNIRLTTNNNNNIDGDALNDNNENGEKHRQERRFIDNHLQFIEFYYDFKSNVV